MTLLIVGNGTLGLQLSGLLGLRRPRSQINDLHVHDRRRRPRARGRDDARRASGAATSRSAQVAEPIRDEGVVSRVVIFSVAADRRAGATSRSIRRQILVAGATRRCCSRSVGGFVVSRAIARRVQAPRAGRRAVAAGDFTAVFPADTRRRARPARPRARRHAAPARRSSRPRARRFIATASHELRTPIFSLGGFLELLEDEELDDDDAARSSSRIVREQVERLGKLATDLLDLSRLEAGSLELRPEPTDLGELARARRRRSSRPRSHKHESDARAAPGRRADRGRLRS